MTLEISQGYWNQTPKQIPQKVAAQVSTYFNLDRGKHEWTITALNKGRAEIQNL